MDNQTSDNKMKNKLVNCKIDLILKKQEFSSNVKEMEKY